MAKYKLSTDILKAMIIDLGEGVTDAHVDKTYHYIQVFAVVEGKLYFASIRKQYNEVKTSEQGRELVVALLERMNINAKE